VTRSSATDSGVWRGAILAAGGGSRIRPFSELTPKPLLPLLDRSLLGWQIERMREVGIEEITVVIGHLGELVRRALGDGEAYGVRLSYVEQADAQGIAHAVSLLEGVVRPPFLLQLGDIHFVADDFGKLLRLHGEPGVRAVLATKDEEDVEAIKRSFTVEAGPDGRVRRVVEKPREPRTRIKGCGQYVFDDSIFEAIRNTPRSELRGEYEITDAIQVLIDSGAEVRSAQVIREDLNMSTPADLLALNLLELARRGLPRFVAPDARIDPAAIVETSVVLDGARVAGGVSLQRCLVMPGEEVGPGEYRDEILARGERIPGR
jgi:glucose-1-phosphate thymidylyltransferase